MRVFLAGASGAIGSRLIPALRIDGHDVAGLTRTPAKAAWLEEAGAEPVVCDVYDLDALTDAMVRFEPDVLIHELTDLPDDAEHIGSYLERHARIRVHGTHNLLQAARAADVRQVLAQSVAWPMRPGAGQDAVVELERSVLAYPGVVLRYGQFYGTGTYYPDTSPDEPRVHIDRAAQATVDALAEPRGILQITDEGTVRIPTPDHDA